MASESPKRAPKAKGKAKAKPAARKGMSAFRGDESRKHANDMQRIRYAMNKRGPEFRRVWRHASRKEKCQWEKLYMASGSFDFVESLKGMEKSKDLC